MSRFDDDIKVNVPWWGVLLFLAFLVGIGFMWGKRSALRDVMESCEPAGIFYVGELRFECKRAEWKAITGMTEVK